MRSRATGEHSKTSTISKCKGEQGKWKLLKEAIQPGVTEHYDLEKDAETGQELLALKGPSERAGSFAFSPDGHRLANALSNGTLTIWNATPVPEVPETK